jgi:TatD DNase family protein
MVNWIDTHAHIYAEEFRDELEEMMLRVKDAGVNHVIMPNIDEDSLIPMKELHQRFPNETAMMIGLHPCSVNNGFEKFIEVVRKEADSGQYIAIGEIGMDLYWDKSTSDIQERAFIEQCEIAVEHDLPIAVHSREATSQLIQILKQMNQRPRGVFHCFTGSRQEADSLIEMGYYLGIGGVYTFKNASLRKVLNRDDLSSLVLETDAPYLAPTPYRGKRNEPSYVPLIARHLSEILAVNLQELSEVLATNTKELFKYPLD